MQVLVTVGAHSGHVGQGDRIQIRAVLTLVGHQRRFIGDDGPVGVAQAVLDDRQRVQQQAFARTLVGGSVELECCQRRCQRIGEVGRLVLHGSDEVERIDLRLGSAALVGEVARFQRDGERLVVEPRCVGQFGEPVERLGLALRIAPSAGHHARLLHHRAGLAEVGRIDASGHLQQVFDGGFAAGTVR